MKSTWQNICRSIPLSRKDQKKNFLQVLSFHLLCPYIFVNVMTVLWQVSNFSNRMTVHERISIFSTWLFLSFFFSSEICSLNCANASLNFSYSNSNINQSLLNSYGISFLLKSPIFYVTFGELCPSYSSAWGIEECSFCIGLGTTFFPLVLLPLYPNSELLLSFLAGC